jgi:hypothetical protein
MRPALEVADIFRRHGDAFRQTHYLHLGRVERKRRHRSTAIWLDGLDAIAVVGAKPSRGAFDRR